MVWQKSGEAQDDFARDQYSCMQLSQKKVSGAAVNEHEGASADSGEIDDSLFTACMNSRGWTPVKQRAAAKREQPPPPEQPPLPQQSLLPGQPPLPQQSLLPGQPPLPQQSSASQQPPPPQYPCAAGNAPCTASSDIGHADGKVARMVWQKPGSPQDEFAQDQYSCIQLAQQKVSGAVVNQQEGTSASNVAIDDSLFAACMNSRGWTAVQQ